MANPRGYDFDLVIKAVTPEARAFEGIATTPTVDRIGDIVDPLGAKFTDTIPLLLYHDSEKPVGTVRLHAPTKAGIGFSAQIPEIPEPGTLRDRVNEAWHSIKAQLLRGVSIGFRPREAGIVPLKSGGYRFTDYDIFELSLAAVPANPDAAITAFRAYALDVAAPGIASTGSRSRPGASGVAPAAAVSAARMNISEQLTAATADHRTKTARLEALLAKSNGESLDRDEQTEFDALPDQVAEATKAVRRLKTLEDAQALTAQPVQIVRAEPVTYGRTEPFALPATPRVEVTSNLPPGIEFVRYVIAKAAAIRYGMSPIEIARMRYPDNSRIVNQLKAEVGAANTTQSDWAGVLVATPQTLAAEFLEFLRPRTILGNLNLNNVPFNVRVQSETQGLTGYWVGAGQAKPLTRGGFGEAFLTWNKVAAIVVLVEELIRFSNPNAEARVRTMLASALQEVLDISFIDPTQAGVAGKQPASVTFNVSPIPSSGTDAAAVRADIQALLAPFIAANIPVDSIALVMTPANALTLSLMRNALGNPEFPGISLAGGSLEGFRVVASNYALTGSPPSSLVVAIAQNLVFLADDGGVTIDASREASLEMTDAPTHASTSDASPPDPTPAQLVSMFQTNSVALRAERFITWQKARPEAVQYLSGVAWNSGSP